MPDSIVSPAPSLNGNSFREFLREELLRRCRANPRYSLRAFARALDYDPASLSKVISGKRALGTRAVTRLGQKLRLKETDIRAYIYDDKIAEAEPYRQGAPDHKFQALNQDELKWISDWYHYAILELMYVRGFQQRPSWIARALGLRVTEVELAVRRLHRLGILATDSRGRWRETQGDRHTTLNGDVSGAALRQMQRQLLAKAADAMETVPIALRDQSSMTMAIDTRYLKKAKAKIKAFRREMSAYLTRRADRDAVYCLTISLFPLSQPKRKKP